MLPDKRILYRNLDIKVQIGTLLVNVFNVNYEPPIPLRHFEIHKHTTYELHFIPKGKGTLRALGQTFKIEPGTFFLTGPNIYHEQTADKDDPMVEYCINVEFCKLNKKLAKNIFYYNKEIEQITEILLNTSFWFGKDPHNTYILFEKIFHELENKILGYSTYIQNLVYEIIINAVRCYSSDIQSNYIIPQKTLNDSRRLMIDDFFRKYDKSRTPKLLARELGVSIRQLDRIMRQYYSMSFKEKLISTRFDISEDLLKRTDLSVTEIAANVGFSSSSYFCKLFKEKNGITPLQFRKKV